MLDFYSVDLSNWFLNPFIFLASTAPCDSEFYKCKLCEEVLLCVLSFVVWMTWICLCLAVISLVLSCCIDQTSYNFVLVHLSFFFLFDVIEFWTLFQFPRLTFNSNSVLSSTIRLYQFGVTDFYILCCCPDNRQE